MHKHAFRKSTHGAHHAAHGAHQNNNAPASHHTTHHRAAHKNPHHNRAPWKSFIIFLLISLVVIAGIVIGLQTAGVKGLLTTKETPKETQCNTAARTLNSGIIVYGSLPCFGTRAEQKIEKGSVIARFKFFNNSVSAIGPIKSIEIKNNGFSAGENVRYKLMLSSENREDYAANAIATSSSDSLNFSAAGKEFTVASGAYRYLSVAIENSAGLSQGDIFCLQIVSIGDLKMGNKPVLGCVVKK